MSSGLEELGNLLEDNDITIADIEFIIKFMVSEDISPQLAMRRIKTFDQLKEKIEDNTDKKKIEELQALLTDTRKKLKETEARLEELQNAKSGLESEKIELETKSELLDSEREELQRQLQMLQEMQFDEPADTDGDLIPIINELINQLDEIVVEQNNMDRLINPIKEILTNISENNSFEMFDKKNYINSFIDLIKQNTPAKSSSYKPVSEMQKHQMDLVNEVKQKSNITQNLSSNPPIKQEKKEEIEKTSVKKKKSEKQEVDDYTQKVNQVLNLFIEFIQEADNDKGLQERISTICDMDEAYEYLGSIGLSQIYSFSSKGIEKKTELINLFNSWKKDGVPR